MRLSSALTILWVSTLVFEASAAVVVGSYSEKACAEDAPTQKEGEAMSFGLNYACDSQQPPSAWTSTHEATEAVPQYDLVIVGAGIGAAYVISELNKRLGHAAFLKLKIGFYEKSGHAGGRLMSAFGGGALGLAVNPAEQQYNYPNPEYGGMRIDGENHPLMFKLVQEENEKLWPGTRCVLKNDGEVDCPNMMVPMQVGDVRYSSTNPNAGAYLKSSDVLDRSVLFPGGFNLEAVAKHKGTPFDHCVLFAVVALPAFYGDDLAKNSPETIGEATEKACESCSAIPGLCRLCQEFPDPAAAFRSCSGYDSITSDTSTVVGIDFVSEIFNVFQSSYLNLFIGGFQRFLQGVMFSGTDGHLDVAIEFNKQLTEVSFVGSDAPSANDLAQRAAEAVEGANSVPVEIVSAQTAVRVAFSDGSAATSRAAYLCPLPADLIKFQGLGAWRPVVEKFSNPVAGDAMKLVMHWNTYSLSNALKMSPCWPGPCERLILDGPGGFLPRQVWFWDNQTVLLYNAMSGQISEAASTTTNKIARTEGMEALTSTIIGQISEALGFRVPQPDWVRLKYWPLGVFADFANLEAIDSDPILAGQKLSSAISRPFGSGAPVFYGNSEMAGDVALHSWAEGALNMAERNMDGLVGILSDGVFSFSYSSSFSG